MNSGQEIGPGKTLDDRSRDAKILAIGAAVGFSVASQNNKARVLYRGSIENTNDLDQSVRRILGVGEGQQTTHFSVVQDALVQAALSLRSIDHSTKNHLVVGKETLNVLRGDALQKAEDMDEERVWKNNLLKALLMLGRGGSGTGIPERSKRSLGSGLGDLAQGAIATAAGARIATGLGLVGRGAVGGAKVVQTGGVLGRLRSAFRAVTPTAIGSRLAAAANTIKGTKVSQILGRAGAGISRAGSATASGLAKIPGVTRAGQAVRFLGRKIPIIGAGITGIMEGLDALKEGKEASEVIQSASFGILGGLTLLDPKSLNRGFDEAQAMAAQPGVLSKIGSIGTFTKSIGESAATTAKDVIGLGAAVLGDEKTAQKARDINIRKTFEDVGDAAKDSYMFWGQKATEQVSDTLGFGKARTETGKAKERMENTLTDLIQARLRMAKNPTDKSALAEVERLDALLREQVAEVDKLAAADREAGRMVELTKQEIRWAKAMETGQTIGAREVSKADRYGTGRPRIVRGLSENDLNTLTNEQLVNLIQEKRNVLRVGDFANGRNADTLNRTVDTMQNAEKVLRRRGVSPPAYNVGPNIQPAASSGNDIQTIGEQNAQLKSMAGANIIYSPSTTNVASSAPAPVLIPPSPNYRVNDPNLRSRETRNQPPGS